ncbi:hypothetical protein DAPPUDRAFT_246292 [Daphnia pulex]|uniref:Uncharacterized protein n=1 Tax=Daphnia pulex TaxID=6669 RepID=E9GQ10_DAPPU|nr:hypothetical protein DAPPUDRAFT_246292 [Daphnia pulex]|eukprot:EFX78497.1 hypothetical protein DAPPUDRAFT_246292 [Daphnia pulex]
MGNKPENSECAVCDPITLLMEDNLTHPESPDYDKIINDYLADGEDGSSEDDEVMSEKEKSATFHGAGIKNYLTKD